MPSKRDVRQEPSVLARCGHISRDCGTTWVNIYKIKDAPKRPRELGRTASPHSRNMMLHSLQSRLSRLREYPGPSLTTGKRKKRKSCAQKRRACFAKGKRKRTTSCPTLFCPGDCLSHARTSCSTLQGTESSRLIARLPGVMVSRRRSVNTHSTSRVHGAQPAKLVCLLFSCVCFGAKTTALGHLLLSCGSFEVGCPFFASYFTGGRWWISSGAPYPGRMGNAMLYLRIATPCKRVALGVRSS